MRTTVIPAIKNAAFYVPFVLGGAVVSKQLAKIPGVYEKAVSLEQAINDAISSSTGNFLEFSLGTALAVAAAAGLKKLRKKRDFKALIKDSESRETGKDRHSLSRKAGKFVGKSLAKVGVATASGATLLASDFAVPQIYDFLATKYHELVPAYAEGSWAKGALGLAAILVSSKLFSSLAHRKHGPIMKRYTINGLMAPTRALHPKRLGVKRLFGFEPTSLRGMHSETVPCAIIASKDYVTGKKRKMWMAYRRDLEPKGAKRDVSLAGVREVLTYLKDFALRDREGKEIIIAPSEVLDLAKKSRIYDASKQGVFESSKLERFDVGRIVRELSEVKGADVFDTNLDNIVRRLNREKLWSVGGYFQTSVYDGKPASVRASLRESIMLSDQTSKDKKGGFGSDYAKKGRILMILTYKTYESGKVKDDFGFVEAGFEQTSSDAEGMHSNIIRQDKKGWNQIFRLGFGKNYLMYFGNKSYTYDEWWAGSGKFITDLIPGLRGKEYAPRRIGYVYDSDWRVVAKITDIASRVPSKLVGNYDRRIDVYDTELAKNENFGALLCGFSRFLTHQNKYRTNRLQEVLPDGSLLTGTSDIDFAGQI